MCPAWLWCLLERLDELPPRRELEPETLSSSVDLRWLFFLEDLEPERVYSQRRLLV